VPVLLLHGLPSQSYSWRKICQHWQPKVQERSHLTGLVLASPQNQSDEFAYTPDAFVTALAEFILALEIERFSLVVQGFLGSVGLQYALRYSGLKA